MATVTIAVAVEMNSVPPRVRLDITDTGTPAINQATVQRIDGSGNTTTVRTDTGEPLQLQTSGAERVGVLYDYEAPFGVPVTYTVAETADVTSSSAIVDESRIWLIHPGTPSKSRPITLMRGSDDEEVEDVQAGVFWPVGRKNAVIVSDGRRKGLRSELIVGTETPTELQDLRNLLSDAFPLLLNVPPNMGMMLDTAYIFVNAVTRARRSDIGGDQARNWSLPFQVVDMPAGGAQASRTWQDVLNSAATWADVLVLYPTWQDVLAPTT